MASTLSIAALKTELLTDPARLGYAIAIDSGDDNALSDLLNAPHSSGGYRVARDPVTSDQIFIQIDAGDFALLPVTNLAQLQTVLTLRQIDLRSLTIQTILANIFPTGATTRSNFVALQSRDGSRAEVLWGPGIVVTVNQIDQALHG